MKTKVKAPLNWITNKNMLYGFTKKFHEHAETSKVGQPNSCDRRCDNWPPERWKNHSLFKSAKHLAKNIENVPSNDNLETKSRSEIRAIDRHGWIEKLVQMGAKPYEKSPEPKAGNDDDQVAMLTEFDNINHIDRRKHNRTKKYVRKLPYDASSLSWDKAKRKNKQNVYCYCGGGFVDPLKISLERMKVKCSKLPSSTENIEKLPLI